MIEDYYISCTRKRPGASSVNTKYEYQATYTSTTINGYIGKRAGNEQIIGEKNTAKSQYIFLCDDIGLQYGDLIVYSGKTYKVISDPQNAANLNHHIDAVVEHIVNVN